MCCVSSGNRICGNGERGIGTGLLVGIGVLDCGEFGVIGVITEREPLNAEEIACASARYFVVLTLDMAYNTTNNASNSVSKSA
jgi:hypothetical protein